MVERLFLVVPGGCLQFVTVVFPDHTKLLFLCRKSSLRVSLDFRFIAVQSKMSAANKSKSLKISFCFLIP